MCFCAFRQKYLKGYRGFYHSPGFPVKHNLNINICVIWTSLFLHVAVLQLTLESKKLHETNTMQLYLGKMI